MNGYHTTAAIGGKPSPGRILTSPLQTHVYTTRHSLGVRRQSDVAPSASKTTMRWCIARGTTIIRYWAGDGCRTWVLGRCKHFHSQQQPNQRHYLRSANLAAGSTRGGATSSIAAGTSTSARCAADHTQSCNVQAGHL